jgi:hypothetical protein
VARRWQLPKGAQLSLIDMNGKIMGCEKVGLFVLMVALPGLTSCARDTQRDVVQNAQEGVACIKESGSKTDRRSPEKKYCDNGRRNQIWG